MSVVLNREALIVSLAMPELPMGDVSRSIWLWGLTNLALLPKRLSGAGDKPKEILCMAPAPRPAELRVLRDNFRSSLECQRAGSSLTGVLANLLFPLRMPICGHC